MSKYFQIDTFQKETANKKGVYLLFILLSQPINTRIGSLDKLVFKEGFYIYIGSAQGKGGLEKRLLRHLRTTKKKFWHIDYLLENNYAKITSIGIFITNEKKECQIKILLEKYLIKHSWEEIPNFGSSDCHCNSHLLYSVRNINYGKLEDFFQQEGVDIQFFLFVQENLLLIEQHKEN